MSLNGLHLNGGKNLNDSCCRPMLFLSRPLCVKFQVNLPFHFYNSKAEDEATYD